MAQTEKTVQVAKTQESPQENKNESSSLPSAAMKLGRMRQSGVQRDAGNILGHTQRWQEKSVVVGFPW